MSNLVALPEGTILVGDYRVERVIGAGGFGITYLAEETSLARQVTIKEYFPVDFAARDQAEDVLPRSRASEADYTWGLERFLDEAKTLARFTHPNIVRVYRYFRARKTGYIAMQFEEGQSFKAWLKGLGRAPRQPELDRIVAPLLDALELIHGADFLHRDIAPDNIIIRPDGTPVLIDFGSARGEIASHTKTLSALVKPGYSPYEQYATTAASRQGPWTDIYSLAATLYHAVTGKRPPDAPSRMVADEMISAREAALSSYRPGFLAAIDKALVLDMEKRPRSIAAWRKELLAPTPAPVAKATIASAGKAKAAPAAPVGGSTSKSPPPLVKAASVVEPVAPANVDKARPAAVAARVAVSPVTRQGVISAFLEGWRKSGAQSSPSPAAAAKRASAKMSSGEAPAPVAKDVGPAVSAAAATALPSLRSSPSQPAQSVAPVASEAAAKPGLHPADLAINRRATPRVIRSGSGWRWRGLAGKLAVGAAVAGIAVLLQDRLPQVRGSGPSPGAGITTGSTSETVAIGQLKGHRGPINALAFSSDGRTLVTTADDGTLKVWNTATRALVRSVELEHGAATAMSLDGRRAVTGHKTGWIAITDIESGQRIAAFRRNEASVWSVAFLGDQDRIAAASHDWSVAIWDARQPAAPTNVLQGHDSAAQVVAFSGSGGLIASGSADKTVKLWKADASSPMRTYRGHGDFVTAVAFAPDGRKLASADLEGQIRVWSTLSTRLHFTLRGHKGRVTALAYAPDGEQLASASDDGSVRVWSTKQARTVRTLQSHTGELKAVGFAPDGRRIAAAGIDGLVRLYSATLAKPGP